MCSSDLCFECYPSYRDGVLYCAVSGQLENLMRLSLFRDCRVNTPGCREDRCVDWRTRLFVRRRAHWRALGHRALASPSLVIRDRCPKPNTCRATALSGVTQYLAHEGLKILVRTILSKFPFKISRAIPLLQVLSTKWSLSCLLSCLQFGVIYLIFPQL